MAGRERTVLLLAHHFPPIGGAGVHRSLGFARHLPEHGHRVVVVTGPGGAAGRWSPSDPDLLGLIPEGTEVHRVAGTEPPAAGAGRARLGRWLALPEPRLRWWVRGAVSTALEAGVEPDLILASCNPYETAAAAAKLARLLGRPWVADLEDPWALDEVRIQPSGIHRRVDLRRMRQALSGAAAITTCAPEAAVRVRGALPRQAERVPDAIPIGFEAAPSALPRAREDGRFRIVHTGSLHTELGVAHRQTAGLRRLIGGPLMQVDILTRSAVFLLDAIDSAADADPSLRGRVELHLAGTLTDADRALVAGREDVHLHGQLPNAETGALMRSADLLFLPMHDLPPGTRAGLIPYKTYEYLAAERPILAAVPDGDVRDMLAPIGHASVCWPSDVPAMSRAIREWADRGPVHDVADGVDGAALRHLRRDAQMGRMAAVLDDVLSATPATSTSAPRLAAEPAGGPRP